MALVDQPAVFIAYDDIASGLKPGDEGLDAVRLGTRHTAFRDEALDGGLGSLGEIDGIRHVTGSDDPARNGNSSSREMSTISFA